MSTHPIASSPAMALRIDKWQALRRALPALLLGTVLLGFVFRPEIAAAVSVWDSSTAYNHCFLVLPAAAWLAYERRHRLPGLAVRPLPWVAWLVLPLAGIWLVSERLGIMEGRQFVALACLELLILAVLGWHLVRALAAPLIYLVFLVPSGAFLTTPLQGFTAAFVTHGLGLLGIPNFSDGYTIEIAEGVFFVAQACAGLRFLIATVAFGAAYAALFYRSPLRRFAFMATCLIVPVLANGMRALGIVVAGHWVGSAQAAAADHIIYGWLFFCVVLALLIAAGLPFRQDGTQEAIAPQPAPMPAVGLWGTVSLAVVMAVATAAGPLLAGGLDRAAASARVAAPTVMSDCVAADDGRAGAGILTESGAVVRTFLCQGERLRLLAAAFPPRSNPMLVLAAQRRLTGQTEAEDIQVAPLPDSGAPGWQGVRTTSPDRFSATALWIGGMSATGLDFRMRQARNSLLGSDRPVILAVATTVGREPLSRLLQDANAAGLSRQLAESVGTSR